VGLRLVEVEVLLRRRERRGERRPADGRLHDPPPLPVREGGDSARVHVVRVAEDGGKTGPYGRKLPGHDVLGDAEPVVVLAEAGSVAKDVWRLLKGAAEERASVHPVDPVS